MATRLAAAAALALVLATLAVPGAADGAVFAGTRDSRVRPGLTLEYTFESEVNGRVRDTSGRALHGAKLGFLPGGPVQPGVTGGKSLEFKGRQLVEVRRSNVLKLNTYTLMGWVKYRPNPNEQRIELIEKAHSYWINIRSDTGKARAGSRLGGCDATRGAFIDSSAPVPAEKWTHVASRYDGTALTMFINGRQSGTRTLSGTVCANNQPLAVGAKYATDEVPQQQAFFTGLIDEVRVFNRALTDAELVEEMATHPSR